ncbi:MAG: HAMP domain-containing histidine kinase [Myxococcota bacterium]|nr:HAMP domain-containing histidine kinase [Myxococcota bacterium]
MSLRAKLIVLVLALTTALLGGLWLYLSSALAGWSGEVLDEELGRRAEAITREVKWEHGELELDEDDLGEVGRGWPYRLETLSGEVLHSTRFPWPEMRDANDGLETYRVGGKSVRIATRSFRPEHGRRGEVLVLRVAAPELAFAPVAERFRGGMLVALALAAVLSALGAAVIAQLFLRPVRRLAGEAAEIEARTVERRLTTTGLDPELKRLAGAFNGVLARLESALERQRALVGRTSHALRTPVASILSEAEVALRRDRTPDEYREALRQIASSAGESARLTEGLLALTRAEAADAPRNPEAISGRGLAEEIRRLFGARAEEAGLKLATEADDVTWVADRGRVREMLDALLDNALRYTPRGGQVLFQVRTAGPNLWLEVEDSGPGFREDERAKVTDRFFRGAAAANTSQPGSGLGLSVVEMLARAEGAELEVGASKLGGARVELRWPRR